MTSIASTAAQSYSPLSRLQNELSSEVSSGAISSGDQSALSSALTDIDSELKSQSASGSQPPSPGDMQNKINDLIANEVSNGKLTSAQANELKNVFAQAFKNGPDGHGGPGGAGGAGGPPPGGGGGSAGGAAGGGSSSSASTNPADLNKDGVVTAAEQAEYDATHPGDVTSSSSKSSNSSSNTSGATSSSNSSQALSDFLKLLQNTQGSSSSYGSDGNSLISQIQSLVMNYQT